MPKHKEEDEEVLLTLQEKAEDFDFFNDEEEKKKEGKPQSKKAKKRNPKTTVTAEDVAEDSLPETSEPATKEEEQEVAVEPEAFDDNPLLNDPYDGQLSVDVIDADNEILIVSTIAGVRLEDIDVTINHDMVTIKGMRQQHSEVEEDQYLYQECYWGGFSRSIILPEDVDADSATATLEHGILTIRLPKTHKSRVKRLEVEEKE